MSTFSCLRYHLVFSTKYRTPWIKESWRQRLHAYLGGTLNALDATPLDIGGVDDHVHLLLGLHTTDQISDLVRELKKSASKWIHEEIACAAFRWQEGYAIFSVSPTACDQVSAYISNRAHHHRKKPFHEELREMLDAAGVQYDPRYLD